VPTGEGIVGRTSRGFEHLLLVLVENPGGVVRATDDGYLKDIVANGQGDDVDGDVEPGWKVRGGGSEVNIHGAERKRTKSAFL
jgi:hypothetical protein